MKLLLLLALLLPFAAGADIGQDRALAAGQSLLGQDAPRLRLTTIDGQILDLGALYGKKAVYLKFWATWCVPCREQMPHFQHVFETAGDDLAVIAVDAGFSDTIEKIRSYREKVGITMPIVLDDGKLAEALKLRVTPQHVVIGRDGKIAYVGHLADARLDQALADARISPPMTLAAAAPPPPAKKLTGLPLLNGASFPFADPEHRRPTVLVFLSPWCESYLAASQPETAGRCRKVREQAEILAKDGKRRALGIAFGLWAEARDVAEYRDKYGIKLPLAFDETGSAFRQFGVSTVPAILILERDGKTIRRLEDPTQLGDKG